MNEKIQKLRELLQLVKKNPPPVKSAGVDLETLNAVVDALDAAEARAKAYHDSLERVFHALPQETWNADFIAKVRWCPWCDRVTAENGECGCIGG